MSYTQTVYYRFRPDYNAPEKLGDFGGIPWEYVTAAYDRLIAKRLPSCLSWCGDEILGPYEPDAEEEAELANFPGFGRFDAVLTEAWEELCGLPDEAFYI